MAGRKQAVDKRQATEDVVIGENPNVPGYTQKLNGTIYRTMKTALLKVLPARAPGLTQAEMIEAVKPHLPEDLFPGGAKWFWTQALIPCE